MPALSYPVARLIDSALVGELTLIGPGDRPLVYPMTPLLWGERIYLTSSVLDARKVSHIKANPRACFSITNAEAAKGMTGRLLIECDARAAEDDLTAGWARLLDNWRRKDPSVDLLLKARLAFPLLFERILIELTPRRTWFWPDGRTDRAPLVTVAAEVAR